MAATLIEIPTGKFEFQLSPKGKTFSLPKFNNLPMEFVDKMIAAAQENSELADTKALKLYADYIRENCPGIEKYNLTIAVVSQIVRAWQEDSGVDMGELQASTN